MVVHHVWVVPGSTQLVEYVVVSLAGCLGDDPRPLQEVGPHVSSSDPVFLVKPDLNVLAKPTAVVIPSGLSITNCLLGKRERRRYLNYLLQHSIILYTMQYSTPVRAYT